MRRHLLAIAALTFASVAHAQDVAPSPVPERHVAISRDVDYPGGDLATLFDTTLDACQAVCLADSRCTAFTFNQRSGSCFPKSDVGAVSPYQGAISGRIVTTEPQVLAQAPARAAELFFLGDGSLGEARILAEQIGRYHSADEWSVGELLSAATERQDAGDLLAAFRFVGAALSLTDRPDLWLEYARLGMTLSTTDASAQSQARGRVLPALVNAYLRSANPEQQATILYDIAIQLEAVGRGRDMIPALRLAQDLSPRRDAEAELERAIGLYGFRVADTQVDSDTATPRICANFTEPLVQAGVDYAPFVQLPDTSFTVDVSGAQLCVDGVEHGQRYRLVLRAGLPAESGETLVRPVELTLYVRDRSPAVSFTSRAYVLPRTGDIALPVQTVNLAEVDLRLYRVSDRNILRTMQEGLFAEPLYDWTRYWFEDTIGEFVWQGVAEVGEDLNTNVMTRLPLNEALAGQPAGVYVVTAAVPGADPYDYPPATQWFILSDLGLSTLRGNDGLTVVVRSLADASAVPGAEVTLLSRANAVLGTAMTDDQGIAVFEPGLLRGTGASEPALVTVTDEARGDMAFLSLSDPAFDLSDRGVEGREPAQPIDVFLATDRGAYRAGEVIHLTALMRDAGALALPGLPLTAILTRPDGVEYSRIASLTDTAGGHVFALPVAGSAPRGAWTIAVHTDPEAAPLATTRVLVEDFLPERIDVTLEPRGELDLRAGGEIAVAANYLFGAPAGNLPIEGEIALSAAMSIEALPGYRFGLYDMPFDRRIEWLSGQTAEDGTALLSVAMPEVGVEVSQPLTASIAVRVTENSGRPVERRLTLPVRPDLAMIGIRPGFDDDVVPEDSTARFDLAAFAPDLSPEPMQVTWTVNRVSTTYQWYMLYGSWNWEASTSRTRVASGTADLSSGPVTVEAPVTWGRYEILVERTDGPYVAASTEFYAGWYVPADAGATPDFLDLSLDAESYAVGDTATLRIVPRAAGTAVISVLSDRVISLQTIEVVEGENVIQLPVTDDWAPGAYVTASVLRPMDVDAGRNPARALGLAHAAIAPGDRALDVVLEAPIEAPPRETLTVGIDVQGAIPGETAYVTLAAVDLGILNLTGFESPDPQDHYFGQRRLGVELRDIYGNLIDGLNGALGTVRSGGDGMMAMTQQSPPPTEELVAYFQGPVMTGPEGKATVSFDLPAFNGTVRLMAVAWNERGVGQATMDVLVRDPVVVTASLPRFLAPGDQSRLLLEFTHATGPAGEMGLNVSADGIVLASQLLPEAFILEEGGTEVVSLPIGAIDPGLHEITVTLTTPDGRELTKTLSLPVQANDPEIARISRFTLAAGQTFTFDDNVFAGLLPGTGAATLSVGSLARLDAPGLIATLDRYPYGCTEQVTSAALPLLYFEDVIAAMELPGRDNIATRLDQAVTEVLQNQSANGSFGMWGPDSGDLWLDAYVTDFLSRARARGHDVPDTAFAMAVDNLRNAVNYYPDFESGGEDLAYALLVLAREGAANVGDLRYYADERAGAFTSPLGAAQLGAALASYGDQLRADAMFRRAQKLIENAAPEPDFAVWRADFGTNRRDAAAVLALGLESGSTAINADYLLSRISTPVDTVSTQEAAWSLMAANALIDDLRDTGLTVDGAAPAGPLVWLRDAQTARAPVAIANTGDGPTEITLTTFGVPQEPEPASGNGFSIARSYYTLQGEPVTPDSVAAGTRLVAVLNIQPFGQQGGRFIVNDPLPAGFEIDNPNLLRGGDIAALGWLDPAETRTVQFRQERFIAAVDLNSSNAFHLAYIVRAVSPGTYHHPAASIEDMYRPQIRARSDTGTVSVTE